MNYGQNQPVNNYNGQNQQRTPQWGMNQNPQQPNQAYPQQNQGYQQQNQGYQPAAGGYQQPTQPLYRGGYVPGQNRPVQQQPTQQGAYPVNNGQTPNNAYAPNQPGNQPGSNAGYQTGVQGGYAPNYNPNYNPGYNPNVPNPNYGQQPPQQPPKAPKQKKPADVDKILRIMMYGVLPVLFVVVLLMSQLNFIKAVVIGVCAVFLVATAATLFLTWRRGRVSRNTLTTAMIVYLALALVAAVAAFTMKNTPTRRSQTSQTTTQTQTQQAGSDSGNVEQLSASVETEVPATVTPTATKDPLDTDAVRQMQSFFYFWSVNKQEEMLKLCSPSWINSLSSSSKPANELYKILANRTPIEYSADKITGTENDNSRTITVTAKIDKNRGTDPVTYRFSIIMTKEDGTWYVDPRSLSSSVQETEAPTAEPTATATPEVETDPNTVLYYNPGKGSYYHLDQNCVSTAAKYLPLQGSFLYSQVNDSDYSDLQPCNVCNAPLRPFEYLE